MIPSDGFLNQPQLEDSNNHNFDLVELAFTRGWQVELNNELWVDVMF